MSNTLVVLAADDELSLARLCQDAHHAEIDICAVHEPDLGGALTAAAFDVSARRLLRHLPLALHLRREVRT